MQRGFIFTGQFMNNLTLVVVFLTAMFATITAQEAAPVGSSTSVSPCRILSPPAAIASEKPVTNNNAQETPRSGTCKRLTERVSDKPSDRCGEI